MTNGERWGLRELVRYRRRCRAWPPGDGRSNAAPYIQRALTRDGVCHLTGATYRITRTVRVKGR